MSRVASGALLLPCGREAHATTLVVSATCIHHIVLRPLLSCVWSLTEASRGDSPEEQERKLHDSISHELEDTLAAVAALAAQSTSYSASVTASMASVEAAHASAQEALHALRALQATTQEALTAAEAAAALEPASRLCI